MVMVMFSLGHVLLGATLYVTGGLVERLTADCTDLRESWRRRLTSTAAASYTGKAK